MLGQARSAARVAAVVCFVVSASVCADTVNTVDGARLVGTIDKVTPKEITLKTKYAGTLTVAMDQVASFASENPLTTQFKDATTVTGITVVDDQKNVRVANGNLASMSTFDEVQASWVAIHTDERTLRFWLGLGYRHEDFSNDVESDSSATLDSGVYHSLTIKPWVSLVNSLAYAPQLEHFGNYLITHDSAFVMPIGATKWTVRLGVHNDYNSYPAPDRDKLDTTWYTRVLLKFD